MENGNFHSSISSQPIQKKTKNGLLVVSIACLSSNHSKNQNTIRKNTYFGIGKTAYSVRFFMATSSFLSLSISLGKQASHKPWVT
jgi:hypothetical protein